MNLPFDDNNEMKHSVLFGTFEILEQGLCFLVPEETTFFCYMGSWVIKSCRDDGCDEDDGYRVTRTSCQADVGPSEYIQLNWCFEGDMMTSSLRDLNKIKTEQHKEGTGNFRNESRITIENFGSSLVDMTKTRKT